MMPSVPALWRAHMTKTRSRFALLLGLLSDPGGRGTLKAAPGLKACGVATLIGELQVTWGRGPESQHAGAGGQRSRQRAARTGVLFAHGEPIGAAGHRRANASVKLTRRMGKCRRPCEQLINEHGTVIDRKTRYTRAVADALQRPGATVPIMPTGP